MRRNRDELQQFCRRLEELRAQLTDVIVDSSVEARRLGPLDAEAMQREVTRLIQERSRLTTQQIETERRAEAAYRPVMQCLHDENFQTLEPRIYENLNSASGRIAALCEQSPAFLRHAADRRDHVYQALEHIEEHIRVLIDRLNSHVLDAAIMLERACRQRIPKAVRHFGGMSILTMGLKLNDIDTATRRRAIETYIRRLTEANEQRHDPARLTTELILALAEIHRGSREIGIRLLKCNTGNPRAVAITEGLGSGGQALTSAMLLYMMLCQMRAEMLGSEQGGDAGGFGFLIQDNPIGKANALGLVKAQVAIAERFGIQLIFPTGLLDYDALSQLPHIIRLRKDRIDRGTGLQPVELADWSFAADAEESSGS